MDHEASVMDRLRAETHAQHRQVEEQPLFKALAAHDLPLESYVGLLNALATVYAALEQSVTQTTHPAVVAVWHDQMQKLPLLQRDLAFFKRQDEMPAATLHALLCSDHIRRSADSDPVSLLGYLYVLEGSTLGGIVLRSQVARAFKLKGPEGLAYLSSYDKQVKAQWEQFTRHMNGLRLSEAEQRRVVETARQTFSSIERVVRALYPIPEQAMSELVSALNPEAGSHAIANDPREIEAALQAGARSWQQFPYYEWRYGERGRRFTWSDSSWIVTLTQHSAAVVYHQINWLGRLLAARGMPRWLLEQHLYVLHEELTRAIPEKRHDYAILAQVARRLHEERRAQIDDQAFQALVAAFKAQVGPEWSEQMRGVGAMLVAAVADEKQGIKQAVTSLEAALTDPDRLPQVWINAVQSLIKQARNHQQ